MLWNDPSVAADHGASVAPAREFSMNGLSTVEGEGSGGYSFWAVGHLYGSSQHSASRVPSATLLANIDTINESDALFFVSLGDNFRSASPIQIANFKDQFADRISIPVFNAVGNHDVTDRALYERHFGPTTFHFFFQEELFIFLDTELDEGKITGAQFEFLADVVEQASAHDSLKRTFIFSHKLLWAVDPAYQVVFDHLNSSEGYPDEANFTTDIRPLLRRLADFNQVIWIAGDIGCDWSLPLFYELDPESGVLFAAVGLGDTSHDAMLQIVVPDDDQWPSIHAVSLTETPVADPKAYNREYWQRHFEQGSSSWYAALWGFWLGLGTPVWWIITVALGVLLGGIALLRFRRLR